MDFQVRRQELLDGAGGLSDFFYFSLCETDKSDFYFRVLRSRIRSCDGANYHEYRNCSIGMRIALHHVLTRRFWPAGC